MPTTPDPEGPPVSHHLLPIVICVHTLSQVPVQIRVAAAYCHESVGGAH